MTIKRKIQTAFFVLLTLSIGMVSVNLPLQSYAQNNALSQSGKGNDGEQETGQGQSSNQDNQVVSGDASILSGNSVICQNQDNAEVESSLCQDIADTIPSDIDLVPLKIKTVLRANCEILNCPSPDGLVQLFKNGEFWTQYEANTHVKEGTTINAFLVPVGTPYGIHAVGSSGPGPFTYELGNIQGDCAGRDTCNAIMGPKGADVIVNFHYKCTQLPYCF